MSTYFLHKRAPKSKPKPKPKPTTVEPPQPTLTATSSTEALPPNATSTVVSTTTTATAATTPMTTLSCTTSTLPLATHSSESGSSGKNNVGLIAGVLSGALAVILIVAGLVFLRRRKRINQELKEAELYQQQQVMRQNDDSRSSSVYGFGGRHRGGQDVERDNNEYQLKQTARVQRQPSWWSRKKPLEYYQQVPPRDHLQRIKQQRQEQDMGQLRSEEATRDRNALGSRQGISHRENDSTLEEFPKLLQPGQQAPPHRPSRQDTKELHLSESAFGTKPARSRRKYSPSRPISSIEPISPIGSVFEESTTSTSVSLPQRDVVHSLPSASNNRSRARSSVSYPPPPPVLSSLTASVTPAPLSRQDGRGTSYQPPPGFYDFIGSDEETNRPSQFASGHHQERQQVQQPRQPPPSGGIVPPPIPRATRPKSILVIKPSLRSNTIPSPGVPVPVSPSLPISPVSSEAGSGPKIGGRQARVKSRNKP